MQINNPDTARDYAEIGGGSVRGGGGGNSNSVVLLLGEEGSPSNYRCNIGLGSEKSDNQHLRHRHTFAQFRCMRAGNYLMGEIQMQPWDMMYIPEGCFYGPNIDEPGMQVLDVQFGGPTGLGYPSPAQRRKGVAALKEKGAVFENGLCITYDESGKKHQQDGFEALQAELWGRKVDYPTPDLDSQVLMRPSEFEWETDPDAPGVDRKKMGRFSDRDIRCDLVKMDKGASILFGTEHAPEILWIKEGSLSLGADDYAAMTAFGTTAEEEPSTLQANELTELIYFKLPTF